MSTNADLGLLLVELSSTRNSAALRSPMEHILQHPVALIAIVISSMLVLDGDVKLDV